MTSLEICSRLTALKPELAERFGVSAIGLFGSCARDEAAPDSDIDLLVEFSRPIGWEFTDLKQLLEEKLGRKVDLVTPGALKPRIKDRILEEVIYS